MKHLSLNMHGHGHYFMIELLVPATHVQLDRLEGDHNLYDNDLRPSLIISAIEDLQNADIEPDVWKVEGLDRREDCIEIAEVARRDGRDNVGCIILGRGFRQKESGRVAAQRRRRARLHRLRRRPDVVLDALVALWDGEIQWRQAVEDIADRYLEWSQVFEQQSTN